MNRKVTGTVSSIALVIRRLNTGGAQRVLSILANSLVKKGRTVYLITYSDAGQDFFQLDQGVHRIVLQKVKRSTGVFQKLVGNVLIILALRRTFRDLGVPVIVSFLAKTNVLIILASVGLNVRTIISERNDPTQQSFGWIWDSLRRVLYKRAGLVTANSLGALSAMKTYVPARKLIQVPNPIVWPLNIPSNNRYYGVILTIGRLTQQKAHDILIEAFARVANRLPGCRIFLIGEGELEYDLHEQANRLGVSKRIKWYRTVQNPFEYYNCADMFVLPSRYEGLPNTLLEAMSCGLPVIVSDASSGPLEYVEHEVTGLVVPVGNPDRLADAMERLIGDPALRRRLGEEGRRRVSECAVEKVMEVWEELLGPLSPSPR